MVIAGKDDFMIFRILSALVNTLLAAISTLAYPLL
jgi:hypothetical protein